MECEGLLNPHQWAVDPGFVSCRVFDVHPVVFDLQDFMEKYLSTGAHLTMGCSVPGPFLKLAFSFSMQRSIAEPGPMRTNIRVNTKMELGVLVIVFY